MTNKDLLKEAIAEAKTIREAAIANAKEALEETLTPHLREMLAQKIQEMDELDEAEDNGTNSQVDSEPTDTDHGNIVNEEEDEDEAPEEDETEPTEDNEEEDEEIDLENMSKTEFEDLIKGIVAPMLGTPEEEMPGEEGLEDDNSIEIDDTENVDEINIDELLAELDDMNEEETVDEDWGAGAPADNFSGYSDEGDLDKSLKAIAAKYGKAFDAWITRQGNKIHGGAGLGINKESVEVQEDLNEALKTVKILRNQLQEVNLLNAKLLYVNKVFKSNNLSEGQKVNVIAAFDKAETVREVKLVFETVSKNVVTKKATSIKEHISFASKATGNAQTTAPKEIISEVSDQVKRMQFLAGIKTN